MFLIWLSPARCLFWPGLLISTFEIKSWFILILILKFSSRFGKQKVVNIVPVWLWRMLEVPDLHFNLWNPLKISSWIYGTFTSRSENSNIRVLRFIVYFLPFYGMWMMLVDPYIDFNHLKKKNHYLSMNIYWYFYQVQTSIRVSRFMCHYRPC